MLTSLSLSLSTVYRLSLYSIGEDDDGEDDNEISPTPPLSFLCPLGPAGDGQDNEGVLVR